MAYKVLQLKVVFAVSISMLKLIELENDIRTVFIGDTHGDFDTTWKILEKYTPEKNRLVFLGDYVDRGPKSVENIEFLLELRKKHPKNVILLLGNHEAWKAYGGFSPATFWNDLSPRQEKAYEEQLIRLPLAVSIGNIIALHGALPLLNDIQEIRRIEYDGEDETFNKILWGDYGDALWENYPGRPQFDEHHLAKALSTLGKKLLIRAHQPDFETVLFGGKLVTLLTTDYYDGSEKRIAVVEKGQIVESAKDLMIVNL